MELLPSSVCMLCEEKTSVLNVQTTATYSKFLQTTFFDSNKYGLTEFQKVAAAESLCVLCSYKAIILHKFKNNFEDEVKKQSAFKKPRVVCFLCKAKEDLVSTEDNPNDFLTKIEAFMNFTSYPSPYSQRLTCFDCIFCLNIWFEVYSRLVKKLNIEEALTNSSKESSIATRKIQSAAKKRDKENVTPPSVGSAAKSNKRPVRNNRTVGTHTQKSTQLTMRSLHNNSSSVMRDTMKYNKKNVKNLYVFLKKTLQHLKTIKQVNNRTKWPKDIVNDKKLYQAIPYVLVSKNKRAVNEISRTSRGRISRKIQEKPKRSSNDSVKIDEDGTRRSRRLNASPEVIELSDSGDDHKPTTAKGKKNSSQHYTNSNRNSIIQKKPLKIRLSKNFILDSDSKKGKKSRRKSTKQKYFCNICDVSFSLLSDYKRHALWHEKPELLRVNVTSFLLPTHIKASEFSMRYVEKNPKTQKNVGSPAKIVANLKKSIDDEQTVENFEDVDFGNSNEIDDIIGNLNSSDNEEKSKDSVSLKDTSNINLNKEGDANTHLEQQESNSDQSSISEDDIQKNTECNDNENNTLSAEIHENSSKQDDAQLSDSESNKKEENGLENENKESLEKKSNGNDSTNRTFSNKSNGLEENAVGAVRRKNSRQHYTNSLPQEKPIRLSKNVQNSGFKKGKKLGPKSTKQTYFCSICDESFTLSYDYKRHNLRHEKPEMLRIDVVRFLLPTYIKASEFSLHFTKKGFETTKNVCSPTKIDAIVHKYIANEQNVETFEDADFNNSNEVDDIIGNLNSSDNEERSKNSASLNKENTIDDSENNLENQDAPAQDTLITKIPPTESEVNETVREVESKQNSFEEVRTSADDNAEASNTNLEQQESEGIQENTESNDNTLSTEIHENSSKDHAHESDSESINKDEDIVENENNEVSRFSTDADDSGEVNRTRLQQETCINESIQKNTESNDNTLSTEVHENSSKDHARESDNDSINEEEDIVENENNEGSRVSTNADDSIEELNITQAELQKSDFDCTSIKNTDKLHNKSDTLSTEIHENNAYKSDSESSNKEEKRVENENKESPEDLSNVNDKTITSNENNSLEEIATITADGGDTNETADSTDTTNEMSSNVDSTTEKNSRLSEREEYDSDRTSIDDLSYQIPKDTENNSDISDVQEDAVEKLLAEIHGTSENEDEDVNDEDVEAREPDHQNQDLENGDEKPYDKFSRKRRRNSDTDNDSSEDDNVTQASKRVRFAINYQCSSIKHKVATILDRKDYDNSDGVEENALRLSDNDQ